VTCKNDAETGKYWTLIYTPALHNVGLLFQKYHHGRGKMSFKRSRTSGSSASVKNL